MQNFRSDRNKDFEYRKADTGTDEAVRKPGDIVVNGTSIRLVYRKDANPRNPRGLYVLLTPMEITPEPGSPYGDRLVYAITRTERAFLLPLARQNDKAMLAAAQKLDPVAPEVADLFRAGQTAEALALVARTLAARPGKDDSDDSTSVEYHAPYSTLKPSAIEALFAGKKPAL